MKVSYCCTPNLQQIISAHNSKLQKAKLPKPNPPKLCNCPRYKECPVRGECLKSEIVYQATVEHMNTNHVETYVGLSSQTFKARLAGHTKSFKHRRYSSDTTLSAHVWKLRDEGVPFQLTWRIIDRGKAYDYIKKKCDLCIKEKYHIIFRPKSASLNKRNELGANCRHKDKTLLKNFSNR